MDGTPSAGQLVQALDADVAELDEATAALNSRQWTATEVERRREQLRDSKAYGPKAREVFEAAVRTAEAEGRVRDDMSPTVPNLLEKHGKNAWVVPRIEYNLLSAFSQHAAGRPEPGSSWEMEQNYEGLELGWAEPQRAARDFRDALEGQGRRAMEGADYRKPGNTRAGTLEGHVLAGMVFRGAAPSWVGGTLGVPVQPQPGDEDLVAAQRARFEVLEATYRYATERFRTTPDAKSRKLEDVLGLGHLPGMRWQGFRTRDEFRHHLSKYMADTNAARRALSAARTQLDGANRKRVHEAINAGILAGKASRRAGR